MPTLNSGERRFLNLDAGKVLAVSVDAVSSAILRAYPTIQGGESTGQTLVGVGAPVIRGPYTAPTRWCIESTGSGVSYSVADNTGPDVVVDASGNPSANGALVSGAWSGLWANRATAVSLGYTTAFFTDVGVGGSYWDYLGSKWRPQARRLILKNLITAVSNNAAPKVVMDYCALLAGLWQDGDLLEINVLKTREGGTSDTDATDLMIGSAPTTLGTTTGFSSSALATTAIQFSMEHRLRRESATSVRTLRVAGGGGGLGTSTSLTTLTTGLTNMDSNDVYLQITSDLTTAGGEVSWLRGFTVELITGA